MEYNLSDFPKTFERYNMLKADFTGMENLQEIMQRYTLLIVGKNKGLANSYSQGNISFEDLDAGLAEAIRKELGATLGKLRNMAVRNARSAGAGSASSAVLRQMYKKTLGGNINILDHKRRLSSKKRTQEPKGGRSGRIVNRYVSKRTEQINEYYGPDRGFILRFLEGGADTRTARSYGPSGPGSRASWGNRGGIAGSDTFTKMKKDMELAAQEMGETLIGRVTEWIETNTQ